MNRPRREIVVPLKYRVEPEKPPEKQPKQQPRKQPQKPVEASKSPAKTTTKTTNASAKTKKTERRVLNLDLPDVPPSEYEKYVEDWSLPDNPYWKNNFHTPQDNTTQEYMEATEKLENLPASFVLRRDVETAFGVANLELNPNLIKPIKRIPLYSKLEKGEYETVGSNAIKLILLVVSSSLRTIWRVSYNLKQLMILVG
jgi:hypothetical protein